MKALLRRAGVFLGLIATTAMPLAAQVATGAGQGTLGSVTGTVIDAATRLPLESALVRLEKVTDTGAVPFQGTLSGVDGGYRFDGLAPGDYRLVAERIGYRSIAIDLEIRALERNLSIGLIARPLELEPLEIRGPALVPFERPTRMPAPEPAGGIASSSRSVRASVATDAREITRESLRGATALVEPDVFRALQRLPSAGGRSDYSAELWTRGAPWHETRVYFDGIPLFDPLHGFGALSALSPGSAGQVIFQPGVRSPALGEGAAGVVDFYTRRGTGSERTNLQGDFTLLSAGLTLDRAYGPHRGAWMVSARRSYIDWLARLANDFGAGDRDPVPYAFWDVSARGDLVLRPGQALEASGMIHRDRLSSAGDRQAVWGNSVARVSHLVERHGYGLRHTLGGSRHSARSPAAGRLPLVFGVRVDAAATETDITYTVLSGELFSADGEPTAQRWAAGYDLVHQSVRYLGPIPLPIPRPVFSLGGVHSHEPPSGPPALDTADAQPERHADAALLLVAFWTSREHTAGRLTVQSGGRIEAAPPASGGSVLRFAPRLLGVFEMTPALAVSAAAGRTFQYAQAISPTGLRIASLSSSYQWLLAGAEVPVLRSDLITLGVLVRPADGLAVGIHGYRRAASGVVSTDPRPGPLFDRVPYVVGTSLAQGVELSAEMRRGSSRGSAAYAWTRARSTAAGVRFPSSADRRHAFDLTGSVSPRAGWEVGGSLAITDGARFTPLFGADVPCWAPDACDLQAIPWTGEPNSRRAPPYASVDLLAERRGFVLGAEWIAFVQLRNALGRANGTVYADAPACPVGGCASELAASERWEPGIPRLLVVGSRVRL